jgi:hypothetical protein
MAQDEGYYSRSYARVNYVSGDVFVQRAGNLGYETGVINLAMAEGDKLGTREGRVEIQFGGRNYFRADRSTQVEFAKLPRQDNDPYKLHLLSGDIFLRVGSLDREKAFEVHSPDGSFYVLSEGLYRFKVVDNRETELLVVEGSCEAAGESGSVVVKAGESLVADNGNLRSDRGTLTASTDDFGRWNESRDGLLAQSQSRSTSSSYLPAELDEYGSEFDANGDWQYEPTYGNVWVPRVTYNDWRPYYYGRWVWYPIIGWTWVSDEPWGWAAYHYGRWQWDLGLGWYWMPTNFWGPAWVHWWSDYDYIGWCPLNYYNRPLVIVNNRFYSHWDRDHDHFPHDSRALTVIHKDQLQAHRVSDAALRRGEMGRLGQMDLSARQPGVAPNIDRNGRAFRDGERVFSQSGVRQVNRAFGSRGTDAGSLGRGTSGSVIRDRGGLIREGQSSRSTGSSRLSGTADRGSMIRESQGARNIRSYPSQGSGAFENRGSTSSSSRNSGTSSSGVRSYSGNNSSGTIRRDSSSSPRNYDNSRAVREFRSSSTSSGSRYSSTSGSGSISRSSSPRTFDSRSSSGSNSTSRSGSSVPDYLRSRGTITERSSRYSGSSNRSASGSTYGAPRESRSYSYPRSYSSPSRSSSAPSRSYSSPSRSYNAPSRDYSRSYSAPSRSYSSPSSRSYGSSSQSYSAPSRSYSSPSRSYNAPSRDYSRSYSAPSRSYSSPSSRSYGSSSHSYSAPSRSSSSSSRSSGSYSRSSGSSSSHSSSSRSSSSSSSGSRRHGR